MRFSRLSLSVQLSILVFASVASAQTITTSPLSSNILCAGDSITIPFTASAGFIGKNAFTAQLSDSNGRFDKTFLNIGSVKQTTSGQMRAYVPPSLGYGGRFRIRVIGSNPYTVGSDNGSDVAIGEHPYVNIRDLLDGDNNPLLEGSIVFRGEFSGATSALWDFGAGATPQTSSRMDSVLVVYNTPGKKTITLTGFSPNGCQTKAEGYIHVYSCNPVIPANVIIDSIPAGFPARNYSNKTVWVVPGATLSGSISNATIFAESGSAIQDIGSNNVVYMRKGASFVGQSWNMVFIEEPEVGLNNVGSETVLTCPSLAYDYSVAPPYKINPKSVATQKPMAISISPNPVAGVLTVDLPVRPFSVALYNVLGHEVLTSSGEQGSHMRFDVASLAEGTYYLRVEHAGGHEMRKVVVAR